MSDLNDLSRPVTTDTEPNTLDTLRAHIARASTWAWNNTANKVAGMVSANFTTTTTGNGLTGYNTKVSMRLYRRNDANTSEHEVTILPGVSVGGIAALATKLNHNVSNYVASGVQDNVVGNMAWRAGGNSHVIFDASAGVSPSGAAVGNTDSTALWTSTYPTLMGWNGTQTYGVRVDSARRADSAGAADSSPLLSFANINNGDADEFFTSTPFGHTRWTDSYGASNGPNATRFLFQSIRHAYSGGYYGIQYAHGWEGNANRTFHRNVENGTFGSWVEQINTANILDHLKLMWPVGSVYFNNSVTTNPATLLGFGTWVAISKSKVLIGLDASDTLFDTLGETGGSKDAVVVSHDHTASSDTAGSHSHSVSHSNVTGVSAGGTIAGGSPGSNTSTTTGSAGSHAHSITVNSTGSSGVNANLQPYLVVCIWARTA